MTPIEIFAEQELGITLTPVQVSIIKAWSGSPKPIFFLRNRAGISTAQEVIRRYIHAGVTGEVKHV